MIKCTKQGDAQWMVWNTQTMATATIVKITEMYMGERRNCGYRVDVEGRTIASAIDNFQTAKKIASDKIKEG